LIKKRRPTVPAFDDVLSLADFWVVLGGDQKCAPELSGAAADSILKLGFYGGLL
jgi:hypothetical protein